MKDNEAINMLKAKLTCMELEILSCTGKGCDKDCESCEYNYTQGNMGEQKKSLKVAIQALEEIREYRVIGTVEECRAAVEKHTAVSRIILDGKYFCPFCKNLMPYPGYCGCGQKLY